jgi:hypothetical protein
MRVCAGFAYCLTNWEELEVISHPLPRSFHAFQAALILSSPALTSPPSIILARTWRGVGLERIGKGGAHSLIPEISSKLFLLQQNNTDLIEYL